MLSIVVNLMTGRAGCSGSRAFRGLLDEALQGVDGLLRELSGGHPPMVACNDPGLARLFPDSAAFPGKAAPAEWREWSGALHHARQSASPNADLLVLSPCLGPVSTGLLRFFLDRCSDHPDRTTVAASHYHHNLHPSWLLCLPEAGERDRVVCTVPPGQFRPESFLLPKVLTCFPPRSAVCRSQDLPTLFRAHGSMMLCPAECAPAGTDSRDDVAVLPLDPSLFHPVHVLASYTGSPLC
ncbi:MAG: hypothetical protein AB1916_01380 [Thermodesulfobacteriota bacterium]